MRGFTKFILAIVIAVAISIIIWYAIPYVKTYLGETTETMNPSLK